MDLPLKILYVFSFLVGVQLSAEAQLGPAATGCVTVDGVGNATLSWFAPTNGAPASFVSYDIFLEDNNGDVLLTTINNYGTTLFTHIGANADLGSNCYYIIVNSTDGVNQNETQSLTFCSLFLEDNNMVSTPPPPDNNGCALPFTNPDGFADLEWNDPIPSFVDASGSYTLEILIPGVAWQTLEALDSATLDYYFEVFPCGPITYSFRINYQGASGCLYESNEIQACYVNTVDPEAPEITGVDIVPGSDDFTVKWNSSISPDANSYELYLCTGTISDAVLSTLIPSVISDFTVGFIPPQNSPQVSSQCFRMATTDVCGNQGPAPDDCFCTILTTAQRFQCSEDVMVEWNFVESYDESNVVHTVYHSLNETTGYLPIGNVDGVTSEFLHEGVVLGVDHFYYVVATDTVNNYSSQSNSYKVFVNYDSGPAAIYLDYASVVGGTVDIMLNVLNDPLDLGTYDYTLEHFSEALGIYEAINSFSFVQAPFVNFVDAVADPDSKPEEYRVLVTNDCGDTLLTSNIGRTIHIEGLANSENLVNTLTWTNYEGWENGVDSYSLYRSVDGGAPNLIASLDGNTRSYEDDVSQFLTSKGRFCYFLEAQEVINSIPSSNLATSNEVCIAQDPIVHIPNAMLINGFNEIWRPIISFADYDRYEALVVNRWGEQVFYTRDPDEAWQGVGDKRTVPEGQYIYFVSLTDGLGNLITRNGPIYVIKNEKQ